MTLPDVSALVPIAWGYDATVDTGDGVTRGLRLVGRPDVSVLETAANEEPPLAGSLLRTLAARASFARPRFDGGEGLAYVGVDDDATLNRFYDSRGADIHPDLAPGQVPHITALRTTENTLAVDGPGHLVYYDDKLWTTTASAPWLAYDSDPTGTPALVTEDPSDGEGGWTAMGGLAALGDYLYASEKTVGGIHRKLPAGSWAHWSDLLADRLWAVKGRIIASAAGPIGGEHQLHEARAGADSVLLYTLPQGVTWVDVVDVGAAILAAADDGTVYAFAVEPDGIDLLLRGEAKFEHERCWGLAAIHDVVFVATFEPTTAAVGSAIGRLWAASLGPDYGLEDRQVLREWGTPSTTYNARPTGLLAAWDSVYCLVDEGTTLYAWRFHVGLGARSRHVDFGAGSALLATKLVMIDRRLFVKVSGQMKRETASTYEADFEIITPYTDLGSPDEKVWSHGIIDKAAVGGTTTLYGTVNPDALSDFNHADWELIIGFAGAPVARDAGAVPLNTPLRGRFCALKLKGETLANVPARVRGIAVEAQRSTRLWALRLTINVSDQLEVPGRQAQTIEGLGRDTYDALEALVGTGLDVTILDSGDAYRCVLSELSAPLEQTVRGSPLVVAEAVFRGVRLPDVP